MTAKPKDLLEEVLGILVHLRATARGGRSIEEGYIDRVGRAGDVGQQAGVAIDAGDADAFGR